MAPPFTAGQFSEVFQRYNEAIWPAQVAAYVAGLGTLAWAVLRPSRRSGRAMGLVLAGMWVLMGAGYHLSFFRAISGLALPAGVLFLVEGAALAGLALRGRLELAPRRDAWARLGLALVGYAALAYPLLGLAQGHVYPRAPVFGVAPCPTTIFTFGVLLLVARPVPGWLLVIPLLWSLLGGSAAFLLGVREDLLLPVAGVVGTVGAWARSRGQHIPADGEVPGAPG